jgi:hypothetical protein
METTLSTSLQAVLQDIRSRWGGRAIFVAGNEHETRLAPPACHATRSTRWHPVLAPLAPYVQPGQIVEISGAPGSGKSSLALALLAALLPARGIAAYIDISGAFYPPSAAASGVDLSRLWVVRLQEWPALLAASESLLDS